MSDPKVTASCWETTSRCPSPLGVERQGQWSWWRGFFLLGWQILALWALFHLKVSFMGVSSEVIKISWGSLGRKDFGVCQSPGTIQGEGKLRSLPPPAPQAESSPQRGLRVVVEVEGRHNLHLGLVQLRAQLFQPCGRLLCPSSGDQACWRGRQAHPLYTLSSPLLPPKLEKVLAVESWQTGLKTSPVMNPGGHTPLWASTSRVYNLQTLLGSRGRSDTWYKELNKILTTPQIFFEKVFKKTQFDWRRKANLILGSTF